MAEHGQSTREIEREIEHERAELRGTLDEIADRLTFEDMWNRAGSYLRSNGDLGEGFARVAREKPVALGLTALGLGLLLFGPSYNPARDRRPHFDGTGSRRNGHRDYDAEARAYLEHADFDDRSASGPTDSAARSDPWTAPHHRETPAEAGRTAPGGTTRTSSATSGRSTGGAAPAPAATGATQGAAAGAGEAHRPATGAARTPGATGAGPSASTARGTGAGTGLGEPARERGAASSGTSTGAAIGAGSAGRSTDTRKP